MSFHRSAFFLLGLFPIVLLLWAWADSVKSHTNWHHSLRGERTRGLIITDSTFRTELISRKPDYDGAPVPAGPFYGGLFRFGAASTDDEGRPMPIFPPFLWRSETAYRPPGFEARIYIIPLWFILAAYLPPWLGLSHALARRKQKRLAAAFPHSPDAAAVRFGP